MQILHYFCIMGSDCRFSAKFALILQFYSTSGFVGWRSDYTESRYPGTMVLGECFWKGECWKIPNGQILFFWGVFKGVFVSRIMELKGLGYIFASDCIPKLLFQRFGVFLRGRMYPKWSVLHDLGCMGLRISQTSCFWIWDIFQGVIYLKWFYLHRQSHFRAREKAISQKYAKSPKSAQKAYNSPTGVC